MSSMPVDAVTYNMLLIQRSQRTEIIQPTQAVFLQ